MMVLNFTTMGVNIAGYAVPRLAAAFRGNVDEGSLC